MIMNGYEKQLVNRLQMQMSKREAEEALYEIREALGEDCYDKIRPKVIIENGRSTTEYPPIKKVIWAYFNDRFDVFEEKEALASKAALSQKAKASQPQQPKMTQKQRKAAMWAEVERLTEAIPYMWTDFAQKIALHNMDHPASKITDDFLLEIVKKGTEMDIWGDDSYAASRLQTNNSNTNWNSLKALMGDQLFNEMLDCGVNWGYFAFLYHQIYRSKFGF